MVAAGVAEESSCAKWAPEPDPNLGQNPKDEDDNGEEKKSPWWKFWDDANIPRTEREAIGIIQEALKMRTEAIKIKYRDPPAGIGGGPTKTAPTDDFSIGGRFDPKPDLGNVEGIPKSKPNIDTFSSKFKAPPKDPKPSFGDVEGQKSTKKPKKIVSTTDGGSR
jgi:hypothetical protein